MEGSPGLVKNGLHRAVVSGTQRDCLLGTCASLRPSDPSTAAWAGKQPTEQLRQPHLLGSVDIEATSGHLLGFVLHEYHGSSKCFVGLLIIEVNESLPRQRTGQGAAGRDPCISFILSP